MGCSGRKLNDFFKVDGSASFAIIIPLINGIVVAYLAIYNDDIGNRFILQSSLRVRHTLQYPPP
jgi:hypothetical protein